MEFIDLINELIERGIARKVQEVKNEEARAPLLRSAVINFLSQHNAIESSFANNSILITYNGAECVFHYYALPGLGLIKFRIQPTLSSCDIGLGCGCGVDISTSEFIEKYS
jgi:hypothetical protein